MPVISVLSAKNIQKIYLSGPVSYRDVRETGLRTRTKGTFHRRCPDFLDTYGSQFKTSLLWSLTVTLTLFLPTSHMCVENTVLAFMICLLFNLSYKVTITCKWNQLVYFAITANKPNQPPEFHCISPVRFGNKAQNAKFSATEQHQKLHISIVTF